MKKGGGVSLMLLAMLVPQARAQNLSWAKSIGGTSLEQGNSLTVDDSGNLYAVGTFYRTTDFDPGPGVFNLTARGAADGFVTKLDASGNLIWAKQFGGSPNSGHVYCHSIVSDTLGYVYITGSYDYTIDFDPGPGMVYLDATGVIYEDIFVVKLSAAGDLIWAKSFGGFYADVGYAIAVDAFSNIYFSGTFWAFADFDPGPGTFNLTSAGPSDVFITMLDSSGSLIWAKRVGSALNDFCKSLAIDDNGNAYLTGRVNNNIFIAQLDAAGSFTRLHNSIGFGYGAALTVDNAQNLYVTGGIVDTADFDPGPGILSLARSGGDGFITKFDTSGHPLWIKQFGGVDPASGIYAGSVALDASGNIYVTGHFLGTADFDPGPGTVNLVSSGGYDIFIIKLDFNGNLIWAQHSGSEGNDEGKSIAINSDGSAYVIGDFSDTVDFDAGPGAFNLAFAGLSDVFILNLEPGITISGTLLSEGSKPVPQAIVTITGSQSQSRTTSDDGRYTFEVQQGGSYTLTPSKSNDVVTNNGITMVDVLLMRRHILGNALLDSPYKIIAAAELNAEGDTTVTNNDVVLARSMILGNSTSFPTDRLWQFVPSDHIFPNNNHPFPFPTSRTYTNITTNQTGQDFIGIKLGDVNGSWDPNE